MLYNAQTHTASVRTISGRPLQDVPQIKPTSGSFEHLGTGTTVVVSWDLGFPAIIGCLDSAGLAQTAIPPISLTGVSGVGSADPTQPTRGTNNYRPPGAPVDMGQHDWAHVGTLGNHVAVLEGGLTLFGSATAHVQSMGPSGTLRTIARRVQQITDFGEMRVENNRGKTSFVLRAGANQTTETGVGEEHWTIRLDLGAEGDMLDFRILEPEGKMLFRLHAGADGRVQLYGDGGVDVSSGNQGSREMRNDVAGARTATVGGNDTLEVEGSHTQTIAQSSTQAIGGDDTRAVRGHATSLVTGNKALATGGDETDVIAGARTTRVAKDDKTEVDESWSVIGRRGVSVTSDARVTIKARDTARLDGQQVVLGNTGTYALPKFDPFLSDLATFLNDLTTAIANLTPNNPLGLAGAVAKIQLFRGKVLAGITYKSKKCRND